MFTTSVHRKATDGGACLNAKSECPERYKTSVIRAFVRRAIHHSSTWQSTHAELERSRQILVNNGYSNRDVDAEIRKQMDEHFLASKDSERTENIDLFYRSQMSTAYQTEERIIKDMVTGHVKSRDKKKRLNLIIYYKTHKTHSLVMCNNLGKKQSQKKTNGHLKSINVIYRYSCPEEGCRLLHKDEYIGATTTSLSRRLTMHKREGAIKAHAAEKHNREITRADLMDNTEILATCNDHRRIWILEALYIREFSPELNKQVKSKVQLSMWS